VEKSSGEELVRSENGGMNLFIKVFDTFRATSSSKPELFCHRQNRRLQGEELL
jgi:hypothetical protein